MSNQVKKYTFEGAVTDGFYRTICRYWYGSTFAVSEAKAKSNLLYQFKKSYGLAAFSRIRFDGILTPS